METCCVSIVDVCAWTRFSMISSSITQMPWRHHELEKRRITRSHVNLFSSCHCLKQAASSLLGCTVRTSRDSWINKMSGNLLRYQCGLSAQCAIGAAQCDDKCENTVLLETQGPCGNARKCSAGRVTDDTIAQVKMSQRAVCPMQGRAVCSMHGRMLSAQPHAQCRPCVRCRAVCSTQGRRYCTGVVLRTRLGRCKCTRVILRRRMRRCKCSRDVLRAMLDRCKASRVLRTELDGCKRSRDVLRPMIDGGSDIELRDKCVEYGWLTNMDRWVLSCAWSLAGPMLNRSFNSS